MVAVYLVCRLTSPALNDYGLLSVTQGPVSVLKSGVGIICSDLATRSHLLKPIVVPTIRHFSELLLADLDLSLTDKFSA